MGLRPDGRNGKRAMYTLDRIDVNGNYEPDNCRWATYSEQMHNRRDNAVMTSFTCGACGRGYERLSSRPKQVRPACSRTCTMRLNWRERRVA